MVKSGKQTETGKSFEYACAYAIKEKYQERLTVIVEDSPQLVTARRFFESLSEAERQVYMAGARAAIKIVDRLEPKLANTSSPLILRLQADSQGQSGDVRDVLCLRGNEWEIGLSCKHNHEAVKHSRLSGTIDFCKEWFGKKCSDEYFLEVRKVFFNLQKIRENSMAENGTPALWTGIADKEGTCYKPVLNAFIKELVRVDKECPGEIPARLIRYLIGTKDFYKVIMNENRKFTQIESININGTLNQPDGKRKALIDVPKMKLPTRFYEVGFKDGSSNTVLIVCDQGWNVSMRIHNASSRVEPSLKFDVQLLAMPSSILTQIEPWGSEDSYEYVGLISSTCKVAEPKAEYGEKE